MRQAVIARDYVCLDRLVDQPQAVFQVCFPELLSPLDQVVAAPDVVHEYVERSNAREQVVHFAGYGVVHSNRYAAASARGDDLGGFLDRLRAILHAGMSRDAAAGAVDSGAGFAESGSNAASCASCCPGNDSNFPGERLVHDWSSSTGSAGRFRGESQRPAAPGRRIVSSSPTSMTIRSSLGSTRPE